MLCAFPAHVVSDAFQDFTTYNPNLGIFTYLQFVRQWRGSAETYSDQRVWMRPSGRVKPEFNFYALDASYYETASDIGRGVGEFVVAPGGFHIAGEVFIVLFWFYFVYVEFRDYKYARNRGTTLLQYVGGKMWGRISIYQTLLLFVVMMMWLAVISDPMVRDLTITEVWPRLRPVP